MADVLRWYQEEASDAVFTFFEEHGGTGKDGLPIRANPLVCMPTGTGKSLVIADVVQKIFARHPTARIMVLTHVKELIEQNAKKLLTQWPLAPLGIYSAGLNARDIVQPIIFAGVKSVVKIIADFGFRDIVLIDECHLIPGEGDSAEYIKVIAGLTAINPYLKVVGFTATDYRLGLGRLTNGKIFTDKAYDITDIDGFNRLIAEGYLAPPIPKKTAVEIDVSSVGMSKGEYQQGELQTAADKITYQAVQEIITYGQDRRSWLVFASGTEHADHVGEMLNNFGIPTVVIHSKKSDKENTAALAAWKRGEARCAVNMNSLTTGVDNPPTDLIACLRPTMSTGLWVQMLGRGTRPCEGKSNCLVLDFAGNTRRLGPINDPLIPRQKGKGPPGDAPVRLCPACGVYNHASARHCIACGAEFTFDVGFSKSADTAELLRSDLPQIEPFKVNSVFLTAHTSKTTGKASIKVAYYCEPLRTFYEWISFDTGGFFLKKSRDWFRQRYGEPWEGLTNAEVLANAGRLRHPRQISVWINKPNPEIVGHEF